MNRESRRKGSVGDLMDVISPKIKTPKEMMMTKMEEVDFFNLSLKISKDGFKERDKLKVQCQ